MGGGVLNAAAALKTPMRNGYNAQGVNLNIHVICRVNQAEYAIRIPMATTQE